MIILPALAQQPGGFSEALSALPLDGSSQQAPLHVGIVGDALWSEWLAADAAFDARIRAHRIGAPEALLPLLEEAGVRCGQVLSVRDGAAQVEPLCREGDPPAAAPGPGSSASGESLYLSASMLLFIPNALTLTYDWFNGERGISVSLLGGAVPDMVFFGGGAAFGIGVNAYALTGESEHTTEISVGLDNLMLLGADGSMRYRPIPSVFVGYRRQPALAGGRLLRVGLELSAHSIVGPTISIGQAQ